MTKSYTCNLCDTFIVDDTKTRHDINAEIFNHFCSMHEEDVAIKAEGIFNLYLKMDEE